MTRHRDSLIAALAVTGILVHLVFRFSSWSDLAVAGAALPAWPLFVVLVLGGLPLVVELGVAALRREFGSDLLAGMSIITSAVLGEYLAGALVVLMLSGGKTLEQFAIRQASSVLDALARRMPPVAHRRVGGALQDVALDAVEIGDELVVLPHEICPVDGVVVDGHGVMDESYLTGEPYTMSKTPGSNVLSGSINGETTMAIRAEKKAVDSRYARIMQVMRASEQRRPRLRRLGDELGAYYTPLALAIAGVAWVASGNPHRFLAVLVVATPCPLLIAIPVAIIGSISLAARRGIIIKDPAVLERIDTCRVAIFDKTGTLTYGRPALTEFVVSPGQDRQRLLALVASLEQYSKHPLAIAIVDAARKEGASLINAARISERPGQGLIGDIDGQTIEITSRTKLIARNSEAESLLPTQAAGLECVVLVDGRLAAVGRFRDEPRRDGTQFIEHLGRLHGFDRLMLLSGDRASEVAYLAEQVGIREIYDSQTPEQKLERVRNETARARTVFLGDGINDAPALTAATVGIAFGQNSDITSEAAGVVIMESSLKSVDELLHIGRRMRVVALQSAVGGMALSVGGMIFAVAGLLTPVAGAIAQEIIDLVAVANALRAAVPPRQLSDY